jgi:adenylate cyclase
MGIEIERKFLVTGEDWRKQARSSTHLQQAYLCNDGRLAIRIRLSLSKKAYLTIKTVEAGSSRAEFEFEIPMQDAKDLLLLRVDTLIEKRRHLVPYGSDLWEVDEFLGDNSGLIVAEIELNSEDQAFARPTWLGREVTGDDRYYNASLARAPFCRW